MTKPIRIIGAGLAGSEAAWQCARRGVAVELFEMRPVRSTPAHQTANFAELVCSNSLKSDTENTAPWLLKEEMRRAGSLLIQIARETSVPAGHALAVDRERFSEAVTAAIEREPLIRVVREEVTAIDENRAITIVASGPLTSDALSREILRLSGSQQLYFYDSISPIVEADSIDMSRVYMAARYDKGTADYINCPMTKEEYDRFLDALLEAQSVDAKDWENLNYFESCLPIEEIARRGRDTLRFGPMKPVGLRDPAHRPDAVRGGAVAPGEPARRLLQPGWLPEPPEVWRAGAHPAADSRTGECQVSPLRTDSPQHVHQRPHAAARDAPDEATSQRAVRGTDFRRRGICGIHRNRFACGDASFRPGRDAELVAPPRATAFGALVNYICHAETKNFQPANITFDLLQPLDEETRRRIRDKKQRHALVCKRALEELQGWLEAHGKSSSTMAAILLASDAGPR